MKRISKNLIIILTLVLALSQVQILAAEYDFGGKTVNFVGWVNNLEGVEKDGRLAEAEAKFNVKIESVILDQETYQESLMSRLISGDSEYDMWRMTNDQSWFLSLAAQDALLSLTDLLGNEEYYGPKNLELFRAGLNAFSLGGKYYSVTSPGLYDGGTSYWVIFNKDIIEEAGLPDLYDLYFAGEWTWDTMREVGLATTIDFDNDGIIDQWGIANLYIWAFLTITNGTNIYVEDDNGQMKWNWNDDRILEGLSFGHQIRTVDQISTSGMAAFEQGNAAIAFGEGWRVEGFANSGAINYGVLPLPKGPHGENTLYTGWLETYVLPANLAEPEAMLALYDFLFGSEEEVDHEESIRTTIENRVNKWAPDPKAARVIRETLDWYGKYGQISRWALVDSETIDAYNAVVLGEKTPAEAMNAVAAAGQAYVDELLGYNK